MGIQGTPSKIAFGNYSPVQYKGIFVDENGSLEGIWLCLPEGFLKDRENTRPARDRFFLGECLETGEITRFCVNCDLVGVFLGVCLEETLTPARFGLVAW